MSDFATNIRRIMAARALDDGTLAKAAGLTREAVNRFINRGDPTRVRASTLRKIADALGLSPGELVAMTLPDDVPAENISSAHIVLNVLSLFEKLSMDDRRLLLAELAKRFGAAQGRTAAAVYDELAAAAMRELRQSHATTPQTPAPGRALKPAG